jgi:hypothetical protein
MPVGSAGAAHLKLVLVAPPQRGSLAYQLQRHDLIVFNNMILILKN